MDQATAHDPLIGTQVGNYQIRSKLGEGGMGAVYLAEHPRIGKKVALKVLHAEFSANQDITTRFFNEARAVNDIGHPNIVDVIDYGVIPSGGGSMVYFIMELLNGKSLAQVIRDESPISPDRALAISLQIADALGASHHHRIVHRDLKPDNIILLQRGTQRDFVKVLDFGIAKLTGDQPGSRRTRTGIVMGTPAYMSPEQCEGKGAIDHRTDIYSLGVVLYELLTGRVPFEGEGYGEVLVQHLTAIPARPSTIRGVIPPHIEAVCMKALEKRPDARYPSMDEMVQAMRDPVGYVERHGGIGGFVSANLGAPGMPAPPTTGMLATATPQPGPPTGSAMPAAYGSHPPTPHPAAAHPTPPPVQYPTPAPVAGRSKAPMLAVGAVVVVGGIVAAVMAGKGGGDEPVAAVEKPAAVAPVAVAAPTPPAAKAVTVKIDSNPPGAEVMQDGVSIGNTGREFEFPVSAEKVTLVLQLPGFKERTVKIDVSDVGKSGQISFNLEKLAEPQPVPVATESKPPRESKPRESKPRESKPREKPTKPSKPSSVGEGTLAPDF